MSEGLRYTKRFIILKKLYSNMKGINPKGYGKLEIKGSKGNLNMIVENAEVSQFYNIIGICGGEGYLLGKLYTDERGAGKEDISLNSLSMKNFSMDRITGLIVSRDDNILLGGYMDREDGSLERYIKEFGSRISDNIHVEEKADSTDRVEAAMDNSGADHIMDKVEEKHDTNMINEPEQEYNPALAEENLYNVEAKEPDYEVENFNKQEDLIKDAQYKGEDEVNKPLEYEVEKYTDEKADNELTDEEYFNKYIRVNTPQNEPAEVISKGEAQSYVEEPESMAEDLVEHEDIGDNMNMVEQADTTDYVDMAENMNVPYNMDLTDPIDIPVMDRPEAVDIIQEDILINADESWEGAPQPVEELYADYIEPEESEGYVDHEDGQNMDYEHHRRVIQRDQTTNYVLNILRYFPYVDPFNIVLAGYSWWKLDFQNESRGFLPYFGYLLEDDYNQSDQSSKTAPKALMDIYGHYLFGLYNENSEVRYYLYAIPGGFYKEDHPNGGATGFNTWFPSNDGAGYWVMYIDPLTGDIIHPINPMIPTE